MNILYIAPRFHTNQVPIIKGWLNEGYKVKFISQYEGKIENHTYLKPEVVGYSKLFLLINNIYYLLKGRVLKKSANTVAFQVKFGFPPFAKLCKEIVKFMPDVVILRERSVYNIFAYYICKVKKYKVILYNQTPLWQEKRNSNLKNTINRIIAPNIRITPVFGRKTEYAYQEPDTYFVPFVIENQLKESKREYFKNNAINIICVGKYEKRKNQLMLLEIMKELNKKYKLSLILVGEISTEHHKDYYSQINSYIKDNKLEEIVTTYCNLLPKEVTLLYKECDLFVLPSTNEMASVSQLEAMACGLPVICSDTNGTANYVENGINGYLFKNEESLDLKNKIEKLLEDKLKIIEMGKKSIKFVDKKYSFEIYKQIIEQIIV